MVARPFLRCLGQPALFSHAGEPVHFRTKKHIALLVYLAVEQGKSHRRERLAELLWPNVATAEARHSLATALSVLRPRVGAGILETTREYVLLSKGQLALDIDRLESGDVLGTDMRNPLPLSGFLEGFDIPDSPEFGLWKDRKKARLLPAIKAALVKLIDECRRTADACQIEHFADAMLAIDELSEEAIRAKMEARAFAGDRLTALRVFEEWKGKLIEAVGAQPSSLVEGMALRLRRRGWERSDTSDIPAVSAEQWRDRLFIGRFEEYRALYEAWEQTKRGRPRHTLVLGDSGIGKTTLVNRLVTAAGLEGAAISRAQCYDLEREIPYATLGNLTRGLLDLPGVSATPPEVLAELARYFKCVQRRFPSVPSGEESRGETARLRLTEAFHQVVEAIAEEHPVIIVVDDLHLCDDASLSVLHLLMHRVATQPLMLVFVARPGELPRSPLAAKLRATGSVLGLQEIELSALSAAESDQLLTGLLGLDQPGIDPTLRRAMIRVAGGYPMVLELLAQVWATNGSHSVALALDSMTTEFGSASESPELYRNMLDRMVFGLDDSARNVLKVAAVLGHRLNDLTLYAIADLGPGQVMTALAELVRCRVLRDNGHGLEFVNEYVRTAAYLEVPSPVRRTLHSSIANRLMDEETRSSDFLGLEIAWHAMRSGQTASVTGYLLKGAHDAIAQGALDTAARALSTALPRLAHTDRVAAGLLLAEVLQEQGRWHESAVVIQDEGANDESGLATVLSLMASHRTNTATAEHLLRDVQYLRSVIDSDRPLRIRLLAVNAAAQLMGDLRNLEVARELCEPAAKLRKYDLSEEDRTQLDLCHAQFLYYAGQQEAAAKALACLANFFESRGIVNSRLVRVHGGIGAVRCYQGKYEEAKAQFRSAYLVAVRIGNEAQQAGLLSNLALCCFRLGEYREQIEWSDKASVSGAISGYQLLQTSYNKAFALGMLGRSSEALQAFEHSEAKLSSIGPAWLTQASKLHRADILYLCGHQSAAINEAMEAIGMPVPILHASSFAGPFARWLAIASLSTDSNPEPSVLDKLFSAINELDTIDRVELLCARLMLGEGRTEELQTLLRTYLSGLPPAVANQLQRLGALQDS